jgi:putative cell wall-binding protein
MSPIRSIPATALAVLVVASGLTTLSAGAASAEPTLPQPMCPPATASAGVQYYDQDLWAQEESLTGSIIAGSFPGVTIDNHGWYASYEGAPSKLGVNTFTVQLTNGDTRTSSIVCTVDVKADVTLDPSLTVSRIDATDRYAEAVEISQATVPAPATAPLVYLASGEKFSDALSGAGVAAQRSAPLLLSSAKSLPQVVSDELARLKPTDVVVLGGEDTVEPAVAAAIKAVLPAATITRIDGFDRFEVSRNLISHPTFGAISLSFVAVASGRVFPDALSGAPMAPVLLVNGLQTAFTAAEKAILDTRGVNGIALLGGENTISRELSDSASRLWVGKTVRIAGANRYFVSSGVARYAFTKQSTTVDTVYLATGVTFPDALSGAVLARKSGSPIMLTTKDCIPIDTAQKITMLGAKKIVILGGTASVSTAVEQLTVCSA